MCVDVVTDSCSLAVPILPSVRNWSTLPHGDQKEGDGVASAGAHCDEAGNPEPLLREDAEVEQEHGDFYQRETSEVEVFVKVVDFEDCRDVVEGYGPDVLPESQIGHFVVLLAMLLLPSILESGYVQTTERTASGMTSSIATVSTASSHPNWPPNCGSRDTMRRA